MMRLLIFGLLGLSCNNVHLPRWGWGNQQVVISVILDPPDAIVYAVSEMGELEEWYAGNQEAEEGTWILHVERKGWMSKDVEFEVVAGEINDIAVRLPARSHPLTIEGYPMGLSASVYREQELVYQGSLPTTLKIKAGALKIDVSKEGRASKQQSFVHDGARSAFFCLDHAGQLLSCEREIKVGSAPKAVAFSPDGLQIWTALLVGPPSVEVYSSDTGEQLASIALKEHGAVELEFSKDGRRLWASQMNTSSVFEIDTTTFDVLRQFSSRSSWSKVVERSYDGQHLYVSNWVGDNVSEIDLSEGAVSRIFQTHDTPRGLWASSDGQYLYVSSFGKGTVQRFELETGKSTTIFRGATAARHLAVDEENNRMYISDLRAKQVWVLDLESVQQTPLVSVESNPNTIVLSPDKRILFVSCRGRNSAAGYINRGPEWGTIFVVDALEGRVLDVIIGGNQPTGLAISPDGRQLAFSDFLDHRIRLFSVPPTEQLLAGGNRVLEYKKDIRK